MSSTQRDYAEAFLRKTRADVKATRKRVCARAVLGPPVPPPPGIPMPVHVVTEGNMHEHWRSRYTRRKAQQLRTTAFLEAWRHSGNPWPAPPLTITLTCLGPRRLDAHDNLPMSFKAVVDAIAKWLRIDDGDERLTWQYAQEHSKQHSIRVLFEART